MRVGETAQRGGFFSKAMYYRGVPAAEVERRAGYRVGRLADGWYLLFMTELPQATEFEVRGYTHMSGGVSQGHLASPADPRNAEQRLRDQGFDLARIKANLVATVFTLAGPDRLAKVVPVRGEFGDADYPPGSGIPQWTLTAAKPFRVAAFVGPGAMYSGTYT